MSEQHVTTIDCSACGANDVVPGHRCDVLVIELRAYLDTLTITGDNIGDIRRSLFVPWESAWNGWVRDETAARERPSSSPLYQWRYRMWSNKSGRL